MIIVNENGNNIEITKSRKWLSRKNNWHNKTIKNKNKLLKVKPTEKEKQQNNIFARIILV